MASVESGSGCTRENQRFSRVNAPVNLGLRVSHYSTYGGGSGRQWWSSIVVVVSVVAAAVWSQNLRAFITQIERGEKKERQRLERNTKERKIERL